MMSETDASDVVLSKGQVILRIIMILLMVGLIAGTGVFINWLYSPGNFPIRKIELVNKLENQSSRELQEVSAEAINGGFFSLNVEQFRSQLMQKLPWVKSVSVRKVWPDKLLISIKEHKPVVRWQSVNRSLNKGKKGEDESYALLSSEGLVFKPKLTASQQAEFNKMALLKGTSENAKQIMQHCYVMNEYLQKINLNISQCGMNARRTWQLLLSNGIRVKLGKEQMLPRLERFINSLGGALKNYIDRIAYADLRYSNGFSIKWKPQPEADTDSASGLSKTKQE